KPSQTDRRAAKAGTSSSRTPKMGVSILVGEAVIQVLGPVTVPRRRRRPKLANEPLLHPLPKLRRPGDDPLESLSPPPSPSFPLSVDLLEEALDVGVGCLELREARSESLVDAPDNRAKPPSHDLVECGHHESAPVLHKGLVEAKEASEQAVHPSLGMPDQVGHEHVLGLPDQDQRRDPTAHGRDYVARSVRPECHPHTPWLIGQ